MTDVRFLLGPDGPLSHQLRGYEARAGQVEMAEAVTRALGEQSVLFCEAGTGTGKTLAYLVPAVLSGQKIIISTATRALQEQLLSKDLPLAERVVGKQISAAQLKGLGNYLCRRRFAEQESRALEASPSVRAKLQVLSEWSHETVSGDLAEVASISEGDELRGIVNATSDTRMGARCPYFEECFVTQAKRAAERAQVVIVNHHLFFADLSLRGAHPGRVLPNYTAVIFDEAHRIEDVATLFFGVRITERMLQKLNKEALALLPEAGLLTGSAVSQVDAAQLAFFEGIKATLKTDDSRARLDQDIWQGALYQQYLHLDATLEACEQAADAGSREEEARLDTHQAERFDNFAKRIRATRNGLAEIVDGAPGRITWIERDKATALSSTPVDLSSTLGDRLFQQVPSIVLTSATLTSGRQTPTSDSKGAQSSPFSFIKKRLGTEHCETKIEELIVPSPFDFAKHARLYLPEALPDPADRDFLSVMNTELHALIEASDGGAFVLTTSLRSMARLHRELKKKADGRLLLLQGAAPKRTLLETFKRSKRAVLVATMSFWEGVDVPGAALRLVILEKAPFPVPSDPLVSARSQAIEENGGNAFRELSLPLAQMTLKQGFGRLIRTQTDQGVVAIFDSRVWKRSYGPSLLSGLPPAPHITSQAEAVEFLRSTRPDSPDAA